MTLPDGGLYVTEMSGATPCVTRIDPQGQRHVVKTTGGRPNGLTSDGDGNLWIAEAGLQALICIAPDGREMLRLEGDEDGPFLFPNDVAFRPDGHLYMTDSGMKVTDFLDGQNFVPDYLDLDWDGRVYEIDPKAGKVLRFTNGIAFHAVEYFDAFIKGDRAWWEANVSPDFKRHDPGLPYQVVGPAGLQHHHEVLLEGVPDLNLPIHIVMADGDKVLVCLRFRGTHKGEMFGHPPTGNAIDVEVFDLFRLADGKLVEHWAMVDSLGLLKQLGATRL